MGVRAAESKSPRLAQAAFRAMIQVSVFTAIRDAATRGISCNV